MVNFYLNFCGQLLRQKVCKFLFPTIFFKTKFLYLSGDYSEQVGKAIIDSDDENLLRKLVEGIAHIRVGTCKGQTVYFSESPRQQHIAKMIRNQVKRSKVFNNSNHNSKLPNSTFCFENSCEATPKTWANSLIFRRSRLNGPDQSLNDTKTPNQPFVRLPTPQAPKISLPFAEQNNMEDNRKQCCEQQCCGDETEIDHNVTATSSCSSMNMTYMTDRICYSREHVRYFSIP